MPRFAKVGLRPSNAALLRRPNRRRRSHSEADRLLAAASTTICHRLADPDPIATRAGTIQRPERSHQLDPTGATGLGSLRLQDTYRIDPNDLRSLPTGIAWIVTGGRAAKVAVSRGGRAPLGGSPRRGLRGSGAVGPGDPAHGEEGGDGAHPSRLQREEQTMPMAPNTSDGDRGSSEAEEAAPSGGVSPYAQGL